MRAILSLCHSYTEQVRGVNKEMCLFLLVVVMETIKHVVTKFHPRA